MRFFSANERSEGKEEEGKGEREIGSEALAETENIANTQAGNDPRGIEPGTPANAADALPLSHRDKRHHQPVCLKLCPLCLHFTT